MMALTPSGLFTEKRLKPTTKHFFQSLSDYMDGVPTFVRILARAQRRLEFNLPASPQAGLFAAVLFP
jgi:hypothetical protein